MLEAAGFSRTNPYNIVQQGKIAQMAKLSDEERLNLLKEVGGASVYEDKRKESQQTLENQKAQVQEVDTTVSSPYILYVPCVERVLQGLVCLLPCGSAKTTGCSCSCKRYQRGWRNSRVSGRSFSSTSVWIASGELLNTASLIATGRKLSSI